MSELSPEIKRLIDNCSPEQRRAIFKHLREEFPIHPIEETLNTEAEIILEAIARDETGLTFRMMRGVIAEAAFDIEVAEELDGWSDETPPGDLAYDFELVDSIGPVKTQVKLQRSKEYRPMLANEAYRRFSPEMYVVETQKTRSGIDPLTGQTTRYYRFGEYDILAVAIQPSTAMWTDYMYTVERWLRPNLSDPSMILKFQPVPKQPNDDWTDDFETCVDWFRSGVNKTIRIEPDDPGGLTLAL